MKKNRFFENLRVWFHLEKFLAFVTELITSYRCFRNGSVESTDDGPPLIPEVERASMDRSIEKSLNQWRLLQALTSEVKFYLMSYVLSEDMMNFCVRRLPCNQLYISGSGVNLVSVATWIRFLYSDKHSFEQKLKKCRSQRRVHFVLMLC